ncbi:MAG TPA: homoserine dehydrogenase [Candidatus Atribacteria bacterium]|nr:MAG: Homoserine dehydrogenase [Atribacteria bacterium 34_128]HAJ33122.1 homoserine dehydrogenase [Candidatus Atribacteria bacterium]
MKKEAINIGILGLGTVGQGVLKILCENKKFIEQGIFPCKINIKKIADKNKKIALDDKNYYKILTDSAKEVVADPEIDIIVETIGGFEPAKSFIIQALSSGKHVVTANKEVIAKAGYEILDLAQKNKVYFLFEASVASAIPIIGALSHSLTSYKLKDIIGILNGTTNYILTKMSEEGKEYEEALKEAQEKGYAEADPSKDIDAFDAFNKIFILSAIAFRAKIDPDNIYYEGIRNISKLDIEYARELGYTVKLLALARNTGSDLDIRVHPALIPKRHTLANIGGAYNGILIRGGEFGDLTFSGLGAGALPAGSMIVSDVVEIIKNYDSYNNRYNCFEKKKIRDFNQTYSPYYLRIRVKDRPGVLAEIAGIFARKKVSFLSVIQKGEAGEVADIVFLTHQAKEGNVREALKEVARLECVEKICCAIRVVEI